MNSNDTDNKNMYVNSDHDGKYQQNRKNKYLNASHFSLNLSVQPDILYQYSKDHLNPCNKTDSNVVDNRTTMESSIATTSECIVKTNSSSLLTPSIKKCVQNMEIKEDPIKLLALQNTRLSHYVDIHEELLKQCHTLKEQLNTTKQYYFTERELRTSETKQVDTLSRNLQVALQKIKELKIKSKRCDAAHQEKEKIHIETQMKIHNFQVLQHKLQLESHEMLKELEQMKKEKELLAEDLNVCRKEKEELVLMREEDCDAPKSWLFQEINRSFYAGPREPLDQKYPLPSQQVFNINNVKENFGSVGRPLKPTKTACNMKNHMIMDNLNKVVQNEAKYIPDDVNSVHENESTELILQRMYHSLVTSKRGVHLATMRHYILDSGILRPPTLVPGDIDVILHNVLLQANDYRSKLHHKRSYQILQKSNSTLHHTSIEQFRYFDEKSFYEAIAMLAIKRFPRSQPPEAIKTAIQEFFQSIQLIKQLQPSYWSRRCSAPTLLGSATAPKTVNTKQSAPEVVKDYVPPVNSRMRPNLLQSPTAKTLKHSQVASNVTISCCKAMQTILKQLLLHYCNVSESNTIQHTHASKGLKNDVPSSLKESAKQASSILFTNENALFSMLEMGTILYREQKPIIAICDYYLGHTFCKASPHANSRQYRKLNKSGTAIDEAEGINFEITHSFSMDFEFIPTFLDRVKLRLLFAEVQSLVKTYFSLNLDNKYTIDKYASHGVITIKDRQTNFNQVVFCMLLTRLAIEIFGQHPEFETPEKQITALLQWIDNSAGRVKIHRRVATPVIIRFSKELYT